MALKKVFICKECGHNSSKWEGKCGSCGAWNTLLEEIIEGKKDFQKEFVKSKVFTAATNLLNIESQQNERISTKDEELDRVLGGGIVKGSVILVGGHPGIGKSTLLLQVAITTDKKVLYVSGEESGPQIKMRADRIGITNEFCYLSTETNLLLILELARNITPDFVIIDSIQTINLPYLESTPGSITQIRECTSELQRFAKESGTPVFIIGHINKEGDIAGPKLLEHIVDTVLQFEGDRQYVYRLLRTKKNRFGSTDELGIYEMTSEGLRGVTNPSELLIQQRDEKISGSAVASIIEGTRPIMIEVQSLVSNAVYGTAQRTATGFDLRRLSMLLAVLEKKCNIPYIQQDVFLNMAGGMKVDDPAIDLAVAVSLLSSKEDIWVPSYICFAGEIGLSGEIRAVNRIENRILEAEKLGFQKIVFSKFNLKGLTKKNFSIELITAGQLHEVFDKIFG